MWEIALERTLFIPFRRPWCASGDGCLPSPSRAIDRSATNFTPCPRHAFSRKPEITEKPKKERTYIFARGNSGKLVFLWRFCGKKKPQVDSPFRVGTKNGEKRKKREEVGLNWPWRKKPRFFEGKKLGKMEHAGKEEEERAFKKFWRRRRRKTYLHSSFPAFIPLPTRKKMKEKNLLRLQKERNWLVVRASFWGNSINRGGERPGEREKKRGGGEKNLMNTKLAWGKIKMGFLHTCLQGGLFYLSKFLANRLLQQFHTCGKDLTLFSLPPVWFQAGQFLFFFSIFASCISPPLLLPFIWVPNSPHLGIELLLGNPRVGRLSNFHLFLLIFCERLWEGRKEGKRCIFPLPPSSCNFPNKPWKKRKEGENIR